jgi:16S rRNA (cytidine1402-2'-O)-methyltransferase
MAGTLILAGTPIGYSSQASGDLVSALQSATLIAAEDTRRLRTLVARLQISTDARLVSYFEGNETERTPQLLAELQDGSDVLLVTDAGMPSVSDPGYRLTRACIDAGIRVTCLPGPSAVLTALAVSGLPVDRVCFEGFLPRKSGERAHRLQQLAAEPRTMVFFEAAHRLAEFLDAAAAALGGDRPAVVCRELTKPHEEIIRGTLAELAGWARETPKGEISVVVKGSPQAGYSIESALGLVNSRIESGAKLSAAVAEVAAATGVRRKELYAAAVAARGQ